MAEARGKLPIETPSEPISAAGTVDAARRAKIGRTGLKAHIYRHQRHRTILADIARDAYIPYFLGLVKGRMAVAKVKELLEVPHMFADVDDLEVGIPLNLLLNIFAVRAGMHDEHLNHRYNRVIRLEGEYGADIVYDGVCFTAAVRSAIVGIVRPRV